MKKIEIPFSLIVPDFIGFSQEELKKSNKGKPIEKGDVLSIKQGKKEVLFKVTFADKTDVEAEIKGKK